MSEMTPEQREIMQGTGDPEKLSGVGEAMQRAAGSTDPTAGEKLERLLARNALTSLGKRHPANVSRAERRAAGIRVPLIPMHAELKQRAVQRRTDGET